MNSKIIKDNSKNFEKKILKIRNLIKKSKNPIMFYDTDADGTTSYFQLKKAFPKIKGYYMGKENHLKLLDFIKYENDLIIIFDVPFLVEDFLEKIKDKKIIWADHHLTNQSDLIKKYKIEHLNPLNFDENDNRPSSYLAYRVSNIKENLPFACLGVVSDFFLLDILIDLYEYDKSTFDILFNIAEKKRKNLFNFIKINKFNDKKKEEERKNWIQYLTYECNFIDFKNIFDLLFKLEDKNKETLIFKGVNMLEKMDLFEIKSNLNSGKGFLFEDLNLMKKKYKKLLKKALKLKDDKLVIFEYSGKSSFTRQIAEELSYKFKNYNLILVIFKKTDKDYYSGSLRGKEFDVNKLLQDLKKGIDLKGGGHKFAAGCRIHKKDYDIFKQKITKSLLNHY